MSRLSLLLRCCAVVAVLAHGAWGDEARGAGLVNAAVVSGAAQRETPGESHALATATTAELFLCVGPTAACPAPPLATNPAPPYAAMLAMQFAQIWNGTMDAFANDGSALTGTISLEDMYNGGAAVALCTLQVASGGQCDPSVGTTVGTAVGTHLLTAVYSGDGTHAGSVSAAVTIVVSQEMTTATLAGTPNPQAAGQPVTLTVTVGGSSAAPAGTVTFLLGGAVIGTASLVAGTSAAGFTATGTITTSTLPVGTDTIAAVYASTTDFAAASATWVETIAPAAAGSFALSVTPNPAQVGVGYGALLAVTVTPQDGFAQDVKLACGNLPPEATCLFVTQTIAGGSGATTLIVQTTAPHSCGTTEPYFLGESGGGVGLGGLFGRPGARVALPVMAGVFAFLVPLRRRRWVKLLIALVAIAGAMPMGGCGNCTDLGTRPATYTIEVTGTAAAGTGTPATVSQAVTVNVTI